MATPGWLTQRGADVPPGDEWLGADERRALAALRIEPRRAAWRLGRWAAKAALAAWLGVSQARIQVLAAADGAPEAWLDGESLPVSISVSHRGERALAAVTSLPQLTGCDLEIIEARSGPFVREWLAPAEQRRLGASGYAERRLLANLFWTAKEAAAKVRREGLRLDVREAVVTIDDSGAADGAWRPLRVQWGDDGTRTDGWWRAESTWVMTVAADPAPDAPRPLAGPGRSPVFPDGTDPAGN